MNETDSQPTRKTPFERISPRTWSLLNTAFQDPHQAECWLQRSNPTLGSAPQQLIDQGREREVQTYLTRWLNPADAPPVPFEALFSGQDPPQA